MLGQIFVVKAVFVIGLLSKYHCLNVLDSRSYILNLKPRTDKYEVSKFQLDLLGLNFSVIEAVDGRELKSSSLKLTDNEKIGPMIGIPDLKLTAGDVKKSRIGPPQLGAFLSHLKAFNHIYDQDEDSMSFVFEDDFLADGSAIESMNNYIKQLPEDWDLLYVGHCDGRHVCRGKYLNFERNICRTDDWVICVHAYLLRNKRAAKKLFDLGNNITPTHADFFFQNAGLNRYVVFPHIFSQRKNINADINSSGGIYTKLDNNTIETLVNTLFPSKKI